MNRLSFALLSALISLVLISAMGAQAQTPRMTTVNVSAQSDKVHINAEGDVSELRVDVADESGDVVFQSGQITGQTLDWNMRDSQGERVAAGTYLVTVTYRNAAGKLRKRVEQVTVEEAEKADTKRTAAPEAVQATITGSGTNGKIAKFTGAATIGNSVITESAGKIGIGTAAPASLLTIAGTTANSPALLSSSSAAGSTAVKGTSLHASGIGVWGLHRETTGTTPGVKGETNSTDANAVAVLGVVNPTSAGDRSAAVKGINNDTSLLGCGVCGTPIGVWGEQAANGYGVYGFAPNGVGVYGNSNSGTGVYAQSSSGPGVSGNSGSGDGVSGSTSSGVAVHGLTASGTGVYGESTSNYGVRGKSASGFAGYFEGKVNINFGDLSIPGTNLSFGSNTRQMINLFDTQYGIGVQNLTLYNRSDNGFAWYRGGSHNNAQNNPGGGTLQMRLDSSGNLIVTGEVVATNVMGTSDRHMKANFSLVNPRLILDKLAAIPIQTWNYKSEPESVRHIGAMAQDFSAAFKVGADDRHISMVDAQGVTMAAIQGLYQQNQELIRKVGQLQSRVAQLERRGRKRSHRR